MLILGIDPGTLILGYSLLDTDGPSLRIEAMDVLYLKNIPDFNTRIRHIFLSTLRIIDSFHPDHLAIEAPFLGKNPQAMLKLGRAQGVAIAAAISRDLPITEYEPSFIKQHITGNGNASKQQVASMLKSILQFNDTPRYLDATDALAVAYTAHLQLSNPINSVTQSPNHPITHKKHKSTKQQWTQYIIQNPDLVK